MTSQRSAWKIDTSTWPIVLVTPREDVTDEALAAAIEDYNDLIDSRSDCYVMIMDNRHGASLTPTQRAIIARNNQAREDILKARCLGASFVFPSAVTRGILTAVFWIKRPAVQTNIFETIEEAFRWSEQRLRASRVVGR